MTPHFANHHGSGMDPNAHGEADASLALKPHIQYPHRLQQAETGPHSPLGIVFMRLGINVGLEIPTRTQRVYTRRLFSWYKATTSGR